MQPRRRWAWVGFFLLSEIALGFTGYFAGFREPLMLAAVAILETFDSRSIRHWIVLSVLGVVMFATGVTWIAVRGEFRRDLDAEVLASRAARLQMIASLSAIWLEGNADDFRESIDTFVDRMWAIYYPALAVARVPDVVPHENGRIFLDALTHILTPRFLFPNKPDLRSDSEMVRHYAGVPVAGWEQGTSIAFGYAAEAYVDFGIPLMFLPVLAYGLLLGVTHQWLRRMVRHRELAVALVTVVLWQSLYLFERSWAPHLGLFLTLVITAGTFAILLDAALLWTRRAAAQRRRPLHRTTPLTPMGP